MSLSTDHLSPDLPQLAKHLLLPDQFKEGDPKHIYAPSVEFESIESELTPDEYSYSQGLRFLNRYNKKIQECLWVLLSQSDASLLSDLDKFLRLRIIRRTIQQRLTLVADYDIVMSLDVLVVSDEVREIPTQIAVALNAMKDPMFTKEDILYASALDSGGEVEYKREFLSNQTWMTVSFVESLMLAMQHEYFSSQNKIDMMALASVMKRDKPIEMAQVDFCVEVLDVDFCYGKFLKARYKGEDTRFGAVFKKMMDAESFTQVRADKEGYVPRAVSFEKLITFFKESDLYTATLPNVLFYYVYPDLVARAFQAYSLIDMSDDYVEFGAPSLESWMASSAYNRDGNIDHLSSHTLIDDTPIEKEMDPEVVYNTMQSDLDNMSYSTDGNTVTGEPIPMIGYMKEIDLFSKSRREVGLEVANATMVSNLEYVPSDETPEGSLALRSDLSRFIWLSREIARMGEFFRVKRLMLGDEEEDLDTNSLSNLFPGQYQFFYDRELFRDFLPNLAKGTTLDIISNSESFVENLLSSKPHLSVRSDHKNSLVSVISKLNYDTFSVIDCCTTKFESVSDALPAMRAAVWYSPIRTNFSVIEDLLRKVKFLMGDPSSFNPGIKSPFGLSSVIRLPLVFTPVILDLIISIYKHPLHKVHFVYPKKMHDPYFTLVVRKIYYKDLAQGYRMGLINRARKTFEMNTVLLHLLQNFFVGVERRDQIWRNVRAGYPSAWNPERYKHLVSMGFSFDLKLDGVVVKKQLILKRLVGKNAVGSKSKANKNRKREKVLREVEALKRASKMMSGHVTKSLTRTVARV